MTTISIIIPVYNEEAIIKKNITLLIESIANKDNIAEIICVD
jgi:glycosyltransferase involved in cell wall biosynthesis